MGSDSDKPKNNAVPRHLAEQIGGMGDLCVIAVAVAIATEYFGWARALDTFLVFCFAVAIFVVIANAFQFARHSTDRLGSILAVLMATSATIVIATVTIVFFYFAPESPLLVHPILDDLFTAP